MDNLAISKNPFQCCFPLKQGAAKIQTTLTVILLLGIFILGYALRGKMPLDFMAKHLKETLAIGGSILIVLLGGAIARDLLKARKNQNRDPNVRLNNVPINNDWKPLQQSFVDELKEKGINIQLNNQPNIQLPCGLLEELPLGNYYFIFATTNRWEEKLNLDILNQFKKTNENVSLIVCLWNTTTSYQCQQLYGQKMCEIHIHNPEQYTKELDDANRAQIANLK